MENKKIVQLSFVSYVKIAGAMGLAGGALLGCLLFIMSLFGGNVYANFGTVQYTGITAGIINIFLAPIFMLIVGSITALFSFFPFKLLMKITKGINLKIVVK